VGVRRGAGQRSVHIDSIPGHDRRFCFWLFPEFIEIYLAKCGSTVGCIPMYSQSSRDHCERSYLMPFVSFLGQIWNRGIARLKKGKKRKMRWTRDMICKSFLALQILIAIEKRKKID
jgi:hypothetical protein